ncbi:MAG TPA: Trk system potassium transporter TrkA [Longimicrobiaceae bacterium]|nr:Trk system potassium transporter TrkA [Longimicrobiaceae bacterium]
MRILILGAGDVGFHLAQHLAEENHDVVVVEQNRDRARLIEDAMDALVVEGNGASLSTLEKAGIANTDLLLAVTSQDEINLMACLSAAQYEVPKRIARVSKPDYYDHTGILPPERLGVDLMINPERECALETYQLLQSAAAAEFAQFEGGLVQLIGVRVRPDAPVAGKRLLEIGQDARRARALVVAIVRDGQTIIPKGTTRIEAGDQAFILGEPHHLPEVLPLAGYSRFNLNRVIIAGGSREGRFLAHILEEHKIGCTILETDRRRALALAEELRRSLILHGDATDLELLEMEGIGDADGFVAYTGSDETNLLSCLLAKNLGARKVISLVERFDYIPLVSRVGVDAAVSPRMAAVNAILSHVRSGSVLAVATLKGTRAEGIEFDVSPKFPYAGRPLAEVRFPEGTLIGAVIRGERVIIPRGTDAVRVGDRVIVFALPEAIRKLEEIFA